MLNKPKIATINTQYGSEIAKKYGLWGGVGYYRQRMVAKYLPEYTFNHLGGELLKTPPENLEEKIFSIIEEHDLVFTKHYDNPRVIELLIGACQKYNKPLIIDFDDQVFTTDGLSPDRFTYPADSEPAYYLKTLIEAATAITVSTQPLQDLYKQLNPVVYILPNACDVKDWKWPLRHHDRVTVGWAGSGSHVKDHPVLEPVYGEVIKKHPDTVFSFVGHMLPEHIKGMERHNWEIKPGITWWEGNPENDMTYPRLLAQLGYDIGLAPLIESQFNAARSLTKWFEYTMAGIPVIASNWGPYRNLRHKEDAYIVETKNDWVEAINFLIENKHERTKLVTTARERILGEFSVEHVIPTWRKVFDTHLGRGFSG